MRILTPQQREIATYGVDGGYWVSPELGFRLVIWFLPTMTAFCALETRFFGSEP